MGKKGDALRAAKAQTATYTFTAEQLREHDRVVRNAFRESIKPEMQKKLQEELDRQKREVDAYIEQEWKKREELFRGSGSDDGFMNVLSLLLAVSSRVLIEKFHWKPIPKDGYYDKRNHTMKFADAMIDEINDICSDDNKDIRRYCDETYELYGVRFQCDERGGDSNGKDNTDAAGQLPEDEAGDPDSRDGTGGHAA